MADIKTWSLTSNFERIEVSTRNSIGPNLGSHWVRGRVIEYSLIKIPTLRSMFLSFWFSSSVIFLSSGYQSVNMNGKDNWVEWRHPQYLRDKSSSPLRQAAVERTSREIRIRRNASKFTMSAYEHLGQTRRTQMEMSSSFIGKFRRQLRGSPASWYAHTLPSSYQVHSPPTTFPLCPVIKKWNFLPVDDHCNGAYSHSGGNGK